MSAIAASGRDPQRQNLLLVGKIDSCLPISHPFPKTRRMVSECFRHMMNYRDRFGLKHSFIMTKEKHKKLQISKNMAQ